MLSLALLATASLAQEPIALSYFQDHFVLRQGEKLVRAPLQLARPKLPVAVSFRKDKAFAVWDDRGLTVRQDRRVFSTRLEEVAVSPRIFARDEILRTAGMIQRGERARQAAALAGARRIGNHAYFLVRWEDSAKKPWLEALLRVDLTEPNAKPKLLGRFSGISLADKPIDDMLRIREGRLSVFTRDGGAWGEAQFDPAAGAFSFRPIGSGLVSLAIWDEEAAFVESSPHGTFVAGLVSLRDLSRRELVESRSSIKMLDGDPVLAVLGGVSVRNLESGAELKLPESSGIRQTELGVIVWSPLARPRRAVLYDAERWEERAAWNAT